MSRRFAGVLICLLGLAAFAPSAMAAETVTMGLLGSYTSAGWPTLIALEKGFFQQQGITPDIVFAPTAPGLAQQLVAGSVDMIAASGVVEPIQIAERRGNVAILRLIGAVPNYELFGRKGIARIEDLRHKTVASGGLRDINSIELDKMLAPHGLHQGDYDVIVIGATGARFAALQSGAIDATILAPPFSFYAEKAGLSRLGMLLDYARDLPQTCSAVNTTWADKHPALVKGAVKALHDAIAWFYDPKNREEAIDLIAKGSNSNRDEVAESYDFLVKIRHYSESDAIPRAPFDSLIRDMRDMGIIHSNVTVDQIVYKGVEVR